MLTKLAMLPTGQGVVASGYATPTKCFGCPMAPSGTLSQGLPYGVGPLVNMCPCALRAEFIGQELRVR